MNKKLLLYIILCLFLVVSVTAEISWSADLYYDDVNKNESFCDITDWTNSGFVNVQTGDCHVYQNDDADTISTTNFTNNFEYFTFRFKSSSGTTSMMTQLKSASGATNEFQIAVDCWEETNFELFIYDYNAPGYVIQACDTGVTCDTAVHNVTFYRNETTNDWFAWLDNDYKECSGTSSTTDTFDTIKFECGASCDGQYIYEMTLYNVTDIDPDGPAGPNNSLNVNILNPIQNYRTNDETFEINFTYDNTGSNNGDCEVFLNNTGYGEYTTTGNESVTLSVNSTVADGGYILNVTCIDTNNVSLTNSDVVDMFVDTVSPTFASINSNNAFNIYNYSNINQYSGILTLNMTFADNIALYAYEINITKDGTVFYNETNESISGTSFIYYKSLNISSWSDGTYYFKVVVADSHTQNEIPDYQVNKQKSKITFKTENDNNIKIETQSQSVINAYKEVDRYIFDVSFDTGIVQDRLFHIKTDKCKLNYLSNSDYKGHFVTYCDDSGNWIDFEGVEADYTVSKIDDFHYTIYFYDLESEVTFRSIGGLNIITQNYTWYKGDTTSYENPQPVAENDPITFYLNVTYDATIQDVSTDFIWNGTTYQNPIKSDETSFFAFSQLINATNGTGKIPYQWNITINQTNNNTYSFLINDTFNAYVWSLTNCSSGDIAISLHTYNEEYPETKINTTLELEATYWVNNPNNNAILNAEYEQANSFFICINPNNESMYTDLYARYTEPNGYTHRYYLFNQSINATTLNLSIYNYNDTTGISNLIITARDRTSYSYFENAIAKLQRNYLSEGVWRTVQMDQTGDFGTIFFNIKEENTDYRILYYDIYNNLLKQTDTLKFVCSSGTCELTQLLDVYSDTTSTTDISVSESYNNDTKILTINWNDPLANNNQIQVRVTKQSLTGEINICETNQTGASGTVTCNVSGYTGDVFYTVLQANSPYTPIASAWITLTRGSLGLLLGKADSSLFTFIIMSTIVGFGLWSPVAVIISLLAGLIGIAFMGIFTPVTITFVIIAGVLGVAIAVKIKK